MKPTHLSYRATLWEQSDKTKFMVIDSDETEIVVKRLKKHATDNDRPAKFIKREEFERCIKEGKWKEWYG